MDINSGLEINALYGFPPVPMTEQTHFCIMTDVFFLLVT